MKKQLPTTTESCGACPFSRPLNPLQVGCILSRTTGMMAGACQVTNEFGAPPAWCPLKDVEEVKP